LLRKWLQLRLVSLEISKKARAAGFGRYEKHFAGHENGKNLSKVFFHFFSEMRTLWLFSDLGIAGCGVQKTSKPGNGGIKSAAFTA